MNHSNQDLLGKDKFSEHHFLTETNRLNTKRSAEIYEKSPAEKANIKVAKQKIAKGPLTIYVKSIAEQLPTTQLSTRDKKRRRKGFVIHG